VKTKSPNRDCVRVETDADGLHSLRINKPESVTITIGHSGSTTIVVNGEVVVIIAQPVNISVSNALPPTLR
jgi:hypothetical protein